MGGGGKGRRKGRRTGNGCKREFIAREEMIKRRKGKEREEERHDSYTPGKELMGKKKRRREGEGWKREFVMKEEMTKKRRGRERERKRGEKTRLIHIR